MRLVTPNSHTIKVSRIVGITEAAKYAGVSRWTLRGWIDDGRLPYVHYPSKNGKKLRGAKVDLADLDRFIEMAKDRNP